MATIRVILRIDKIRTDGTCPVYIRLNEGKKKKTIATGCNVEENYWDKKAGMVIKTHKNHIAFNAIINRAKAEIEASVLTIMASSEDKDRIIHNIKKKDNKEKSNNFFDIASIYEKELLDAKKYNRVSGERSQVKHFKEFVGSSSIRFEEIDTALLKKFQVYLKKKLNCSERTIMNHLVAIRTIWNYACREGISDKNLYPFGKGRITIKFPESIKIGLNETEVLKIENADFEEKKHLDYARDIWLFSFYLAGIRISDVLRLKWKDCIDNRLEYKMGKNKKVVSLKLPQKAIIILEKYRKGGDEYAKYIFQELNGIDENDEHEIFVRTASSTNKLDRNLKKVAELCGIQKNLTCHISRHTFGNITGDKISPQMLQKLYRHSDIKTTMGYQANFIHRDVDDALETVLDF
jgi:integrase/recombinase XerD